jgi:hypothetical protein
VAPGVSRPVSEKLGPWKPAVRLVVLRLRVPANAASVVFSRTTPPPRGIHPCGVPSSKSLVSGGGASSVMVNASM